SNSIKMTPLIVNCMAQVEDRVKAEPESQGKAAMQQMFVFIKEGNLLAAQKALMATTEEERNMAVEKYMVDQCAPMKICWSCPVDLG
ncbi:hypothetical protein PMAYCL1PPCAC_14808, partial [Pristionchus mayeri]